MASVHYRTRAGSTYLVTLLAHTRAARAHRQSISPQVAGLVRRHRVVKRAALVRREAGPPSRAPRFIHGPAVDLPQQRHSTKAHSHTRIRPSYVLCTDMGQNRRSLRVRPAVHDQSFDRRTHHVDGRHIRIVSHSSSLSSRHRLPSGPRPTLARTHVRTGSAARFITSHRWSTVARPPSLRVHRSLRVPFCLVADHNLGVCVCISRSATSLLHYMYHS